MVERPSPSLERHTTTVALAVGLVLAIIVGGAITAVQRAHDDAAARVQLLTRVDEVNAELNGVLWESVARGATGPALRREAHANLQAFADVRQELEGSDGVPSAFRRDADTYIIEAGAMLDALDGNDVDRAIAVSRTRVEPVFGRLDREAEGLIVREQSRARTMRWLAFISTFAILIAGAVSAFAMFRRYDLARRLAHRAYHDPLTGLANRALFFDRTSHALALARRRNEFVAVALLDLDEFKLVNDSLGHGFGDSLIVAVGKRLVGHARESDTVARFGGDEFAVLVEGLRSPKALEELSARLHGTFAVPFLIEGRELRVRATIGWAVGDVAQTADELLRNVDLAMYAGKRQGKDRTVVFEAAMQRELLERLELESDLRDALDNGEMLLHYQPIVSLETGQIVGVEALARWEHPTRGFVPPMTFIPIAEQAGLIVPIGRWVLIEACRQVRHWQLEYPMQPPLSIAVNVSPVQLQSREIVSDVIFALRESGIEPSALEIEITESVIVDQARCSSRRCSTSLLRSACGWRSTTSARVTRRSVSSTTCRSTPSRSTARSSRACSRTATGLRSCAP